MLATQALIGVAIAAAFVGLYVGLQQDPEPHRLPIAVVGSELAHSAQAGWTDRARVIEVSTVDDARQDVEAHRAVAAIAPASHASGLQLLLAGADGRSASGAATALAGRLAAEAHLPIVSTTDLVPLAAHDAQGLVGFYVVFGVTLASFILAQIMFSIAALVELRWRVLTLVAAGIACAAAAAVIAGPVLGAVPANIGALVALLSLLSVAVSLSTLAITNLVGPLGTVIGTLVFTTLGNSTSGATVSSYLMPAGLAVVGAALPPGAAFRALTDASYFDYRGTWTEGLVLLAWIAAAAAVLSMHARARRRTRLGHAQTVSEASIVVG